MYACCLTKRCAAENRCGHRKQKQGIYKDNVAQHRNLGNPGRQTFEKIRKIKLLKSQFYSFIPSRLSSTTFVVQKLLLFLPQFIFLSFSLFLSLLF